MLHPRFRSQTFKFQNYGAQTQVSIGRNEKMAAFETNWVILSIHSYTAWAMALIFHHHHHYLINFLDHVHYHHHYFINTLDHVHHHHHNINHPHDGLLEDRHLELLLLGVKLSATCDTPKHVQHQHLGVCWAGKSWWQWWNQQWWLARRVWISKNLRVFLHWSCSWGSTSLLLSWQTPSSDRPPLDWQYL